MKFSFFHLNVLQVREVESIKHRDHLTTKRELIRNSDYIITYLDQTADFSFVLAARDWSILDTHLEFPLRKRANIKFGFLFELKNKQLV